MKNSNGKQKIFISILIIIILILIIELLVIKTDYIKNNKQIIKEMTEVEYESKLTELNTSHEDYALRVQENKKKIAEAITNQGIETSEDDTADVMAENIAKIKEIAGGGEPQEVTLPYTATEDCTIYVIYTGFIMESNYGRAYRADIYKNDERVATSTCSLTSSSAKSEIGDEADVYYGTARATYLGALQAGDVVSTSKAGAAKCWSTSIYAVVI